MRRYRIRLMDLSMRSIGRRPLSGGVRAFGWSWTFGGADLVRSSEVIGVLRLSALSAIGRLL